VILKPSPALRHQLIERRLLDHDTGPVRREDGQG
jgi:hypothetical protein